MARDDVKITAVWDEIPKGEKNAKRSVYSSDLDALLGRTMLTRWSSIPYQHARGNGSRCQGGKHIFTEKVMVLTVRECEEIAQRSVRQE